MPDEDRAQFEYDQSLRETYVRHLRWLVEEVLPQNPDWEPLTVINGAVYKMSWKSVTVEDGRLVFEDFWMEPIHR